MRFRRNLPRNSYRGIGPTILLPLALGGCASLPSSGPTGPEIRKSATAENGVPFTIVELSDLLTLPQANASLASLPAAGKSLRTDLIGPGDVLDITIYEAGVTLFGAAANGTVAGTQPGAKAEKLPPFRVDDDGNIRLPFVGSVKAAGLTASALERVIKQALVGQSQSPQVIVGIREAITNSVILAGEINKPGRLALPTDDVTLSDAIALAGGYRGEVKDLEIRIQRQDVTSEVRLSEAMEGTAGSIRIYAGDRISLIRAPRTFSVLGAPGRVEQIPFASSRMMLAEALALAGGTNPNLGDPKAIFVFRFVGNQQGGEQPFVYHLNMMEAGSFFLSQRFAMRDKDILYVGNAEANQPSKLIQIISQLFAPIVTIRDVTRSTN